MKNIIGLFLLCIFSTDGILVAQVSRVEKKIITSIERHNEEATNLLKQVVNINSGTMNLEGVRKVGQVLSPYFDELGFETAWLEGSAFHRAGHLVARHKGTGNGPRLLLIGHLDTVFKPDSPFQFYTQVNDSILAGPGVVDMKGGDLIIIFALKALSDAGVLRDMNIDVIFTGDEEKSGSPIELSKKALVDLAKESDIALGFENGDSDFRTAVVSRRGSTGWKLTVSGNAAHSSQIFSDKVGAGAVYEASRILTAFYVELRKEEFLTFNPGVVLAGTDVEFGSTKDGGSAFGKSNVVARKAIIKGDLRALSLEQLARAKQKMKQIVSQSLPGTDANLEFSDTGYPPMAPSEGNKHLLSIYSKVSEDLGYGEVSAVPPIRAGAADISFTTGYVKMAMDGLGLSGGNDHTINEFGEMNRLPLLTQRAAVLIYRITHDKLLLNKR